MSLHINRTFFRRRGTLSYLQSYKKSPESVIVQNFSILRDPFKLPSFQLSIFKRKTKSLSQQEDDEIKMLEKFSRIVLVLKDQVQIGNDPICQKQVRHSSSIKKSLEETSNKYNSANILSLIEFKVDESLDKNIDSNVNYILDQPVDQILDQTILSELNFSLRAFLLKNYILQLKTAVNDGNVDESRITSDSLCRITDSFLFGTASERFAGKENALKLNCSCNSSLYLSENLKLFGSSLSLFNTQYAFNMILEAEVSTAKDLLLTYKSIPKSYKKILPKFSTTFLHDKLEVNTKARCIVAWAGTISPKSFVAFNLNVT